MTEEEWSTCASVDDLLDQLGESLSARKLRLFAAASCRKVCHLFPDERFLGHLEILERLADNPGQTTAAEKAADEIGVAASWKRLGVVRAIALEAVARALRTDSLYGPKYAFEDVAIALDGEALIKSRLS